ncbi:S8 family serine peptidase [Flavobacterium sp.]|uniref:S8 family serine peptidase n=1 Tax=Flavobacterium sp. TaxID=239 RepID=UPI0026134D8F|nr:S8 family serine peptidase [Flavobacterium sp.]
MFLVSCKSTKGSNFYSAKSISNNELKEIELKNWFQKDYLLDTIPGISLDKWYSQNKKKSKKKNIIVAVIDTQIDIKHEDLQNQFWVNPNEIPNNNIDDDHNGYVDDVNGWNFTGTKNGSYIVWSNYEYVRIVRDWSVFFKDKTESQITVQDLQNYKEYQRGLKMLEQKNKYYKNWLKSLKHIINIYPSVKDTLKYFFPKGDYTYKKLDSLYNTYKVNNKTYKQRRDDNDTDLGALIHYMMVCLEVNQKTLADVQDQEAQIDSTVNKKLNINFDERIFIGDNPKILEKGYGNNNICSTLEGVRSTKKHCTKVSGIIAANRENKIGIEGFSNHIKIMPLNISSSGDEHDKDIAMAIRYAVDNGAKVINMSIGKEFSLNKEWVFDAIKYAEDHNVLLIHAAGNDGFNIDENPYYPSDYTYENGKEVSENFISVGSTSHHLDSTFVSNFSNYGKKNVDLFAPGEKIFTTSTGDKYEYDSGTSLSAPMVSGTAALIWLYYPKLTVKEVKQIILDSGTSYDLEVILPGSKDKKVPFSELSKTGKVLNVYNAMKLAEKVSKNKK